MHQNNEFSSIMRIGRVKEFDPKTHRAKVIFPDLDGKISDFLPILISHSHDDKSEAYLDIDEHVVCLMSGQGDEFGVILGSFYDATNEPPFQTGNTHSRTYSDGTMFQYDRASSTLTVHCVKDIIIEADNDITVYAGRDVTVKAERDINVKAERNVTVKAGSHIGLTAPRIDLN